MELTIFKFKQPLKILHVPLISLLEILNHYYLILWYLLHNNPSYPRKMLWFSVVTSEHILRYTIGSLVCFLFNVQFKVSYVLGFDINFDCSLFFCLKIRSTLYLQVYFLSSWNPSLLSFLDWHFLIKINSTCFIQIQFSALSFPISSS